MIQTILKHAKSYLGTQQGDLKHKEIIDKYNAVKPHPVGYNMYDKNSNLLPSPPLIQYNETQLISKRKFYLKRSG